MTETNYSGRTTAYEHKHPGWETRDGNETDCIQQKTVFEVQWSNCPVEVEAEVIRLWQDYNFGNDSHYFSWESEENEIYYPIIGAYLKSRNVTKCLIHWWW